MVIRRGKNRREFFLHDSFAIMLAIQRHPEFKTLVNLVTGAISSVGRASRLHRECRRFESVIAHQIASLKMPPVIPSLNLCRKLLLASIVLLMNTSWLSVSEAMTFEIVTFGLKDTCGDKCPFVVQAEGQIEKDTAEKFKEFLAAIPPEKPVAGMILIKSPGGVLDGALHLGGLFRQLGLTVLVAQTDAARTGRLIPAQCFSACVYAVMGGTTRLIPKQSQIGIHATFTNRLEIDPLRIDPPYRKVAAPDNVNQTAREYVKYMGVSPKLVTLALSVSPNSILILTPKQIKDFRLGVDPETSPRLR